MEPAKFPANDLVLETILAHFHYDAEVRSLKSCRLVCRRWEAAASAVLRKKTSHQKIVVRLQAGVSEGNYRTACAFLQTRGIGHTLLLSLRPNPWRKKDSYRDTANMQQQDLWTPFFSARNKEMSRVLAHSAFSFVLELHLELVLRSRRDTSLLWSLLSQFPNAASLRLTFPIIFSHAIERSPADPPLNECCPWVKNLLISEVQCEKGGGCFLAWQQFLKHFPGLMDLYLEGFVGSEYYVVLGPVAALGMDLSFYPDFQSLHFLTLVKDDPENWVKLNSLAPKLRILDFEHSGGVDAMWSQLDPDLKQGLEVLVMSCVPLHKTSARFLPSIHLRQPFSNLTNLALWWHFDRFPEGWLDNDFIPGLRVIFEKEAFSSLFPVLTHLTFAPLELDRGQYDAVWGTLFQEEEASLFPNISHLALALGLKDGCEEERLSKQVPAHFPNLVQLRHLTLKKKKKSPEYDDEELWVCSHTKTPSPQGPLLKNTDKFVLDRSYILGDSELAWYFQGYEVDKVIPTLLFGEAATGGVWHKCHRDKHPTRWVNEGNWNWK